MLFLFLLTKTNNLYILVTFAELFLQLPPSIYTLDNSSQLKIIELSDATRILIINSLLFAKMEHQILAV